MKVVQLRFESELSEDFCDRGAHAQQLDHLVSLFLAQNLRTPNNVRV
jgi:hypothetical protein